MKKIIIVVSSILIFVQVNAQNVGINSTGVNPDASAMLDVVSADKGVLVPRVNIINLNTPAPIAAPALSLLVYNTNATSGVGYYFWDGTSWVKIVDSNSNSDHDWYEVGGTSDPDDINDNIFTQGNVGIGIAVPLSTLHVVGTARVSTLAGVGTRMVTANANGVLGVQAIPVGDITAVTAGTGLTGGGATGALTLNAVGVNGLTTTANDIRLGGTLIQNTTITNGNFHMIYNLSNTGDFIIQDAGVTHFTVTDNGNTSFGGDVFWRDENSGGTLLGSIIDDGDDGRFRLRENGAVSVDFDANTQFILNEQGLDRNTRIESDGITNMFLVDAGTDRVSIGSATTDGVSDAEFNVTGNSSFSDDIRLKDGNTNTGDVLVRLYDSNDDGVIDVMQNGIVNHTIHGNGNTVFNEQGLNFDFKVEGNTDQNLLYLDGSTDRIGIGTNTPGEKLSIKGNLRIGGSGVGPNYIAFHGTTADQPGLYTHGYIGERIYASTEDSELLIYKGNDATTAGGPDRIRLAAADILFDTYTGFLPATSTFSQIGANAGITTKMIVKSDGNVGIGTITPSTKLHVEGGVRIVDGTQGAGKTLTSDANGNATWQQSSASVIIGNVNLGTVLIPTAGVKVYQGSSVTVNPGTWIIRPYGFFRASAGSSAVQWFLSSSATVFTPVAGSGIASAQISQAINLCYNNAEFKPVTVAAPTTFYLWGQIQAGTGEVVMNGNEGNLTAWKIN